MITPGVAMYNLFNMSDCDTPVWNAVEHGYVADGPLGYVNSPESLDEVNNLRVTRNSGTFDQGGPRTTEFQLMINF